MRNTFLLLLVMFISIPVTAPAQPVDIPDPELREAIERALGKARGDAILTEEMETLTYLSSNFTGVTVLTGIERAPNLTHLYLVENSISDITPLANLTNLTHLHLVENTISDITPLANLTNLKELQLQINSISDITPLANLTNLTSLFLGENTISDITPLANLTNLKALYSEENSISDISPLANLTNLAELFLGRNSISDITPLANLINLTYLDFLHNSISDITPLVAYMGHKPRRVDVRANPLNYPSIHTHIPALQQRGDTVRFKNRTLGSIRIVSGNDQEGASGSALANPFIVEARDGAGSVFEGVPVTFAVTAGGGTLSATNTTTDVNGRAESTLTLGPEPGTNTVTAAIADVQEKLTFTAEGVRIPKSLEIISGDNQEAPPGMALENAFEVEVRDQLDEPLPDVQVTFSVTSGGGTLSSISVTTDSNGRADSSLTLGPNLGTNTVTVSVNGIQEERTFIAEGIRIPKEFLIISGFDQQGVIGEALANPFVVEVRDQFGEPLPDEEINFSVTAGDGTLNTTSAVTDSNGRAESVLTLGPDPGTNTVTVSVTGIEEEQSVSATAEPPRTPEDVNRDEVVNILDLVLVAFHLGDRGTGLAEDVNGDGVVNILDLVLVAGALGNAAAAPSAWYRDLEIAPTRTEVGHWLAQAQTLDLTDATTRMGVLVLEQLMAVLTPEETALLPNYPNPFNPETWIPYQLAEDGNIGLSIYDAGGSLVRRLDLGHRSAGYHTGKSKAAYWDGRNRNGEPVASGIYFYHLRTGDYSQMRRLVIIK